MNNGAWQRVSREQPCPVCGKPDWCLVVRDGTAAICPRVEDGAVKRCGEAGWLHRLSDSGLCNQQTSRRPPATAQVSTRRRNFRGLADYLAVRGAPRRDVLAADLGVSRQALDRLQVGYHPRKGWWAFPERDATGTVIGILRRFPHGSKKRLSGSRSGLVYADDWDTGSGPLVLVEGPSDTAALMTLGISAIGRPSNRGGAALLADLLRSFTEERPIVVLGEYDRKDSGLWPGRDGAVHTAQELARRLTREIHWALPPDGAKDVRAWLQAFHAPDPQHLGETFLQGLDLQSVLPPPIVAGESPRGATVALDDYRRQMATVRLASLDRPGVYLDRSPTGSGKSHIDLQVLSHLLGKESAA